MKRLLPLLLILVSANIFAQRYVIVDRKMKTPLQYADSITKEQLNKGYFAVEKQNIASLISKLDSLSSRLRNVVIEKYDETKLIIGTTILNIKVVKWSFADRLNVALSTDTGSGHNESFYIVDARFANNENAKHLSKLIKYLKKATI